VLHTPLTKGSNGVVEGTVHQARVSPKFSNIDSRCFEFRYSGRLLLNDPADTYTLVSGV
jgi:hypothetical protein